MYFVRPPYALQKLYSKALWRVPVNEKIIYLTFDDGPIPEITTWILELLKQKKIHATFFCVGNNVNKYPELYTQILQNGHATGNHTYNHLNGWNTHTPSYIRNTLQCSELVRSTLFRPPYGRIKKNQLRILSTRFKIVMWDVLSGDFDKKISPEQCLANCKKYSREGSIIVFHDNIKAWKNLSYVLPAYIDYCLENGFKFEVLN